MKLNMERIFVFLVVACVVLTVLSVLVFRTHRLSQAEAIEIGMKSETVWRHLDSPIDRIYIYANYTSRADVSMNREVWHVEWAIWWKNAPSAAWISIHQYIDPDTGMILLECVLGLR